MDNGRDDLTRPASTETIATAERTGSIEDAVFLLRDTFGITHVTFHINVPGAAPFDYPYVRTTYSPEWISRYVLRAYLGIDPVLRHGFAATSPFAWHELSMNDREREFMADARAHGVGEQGYSIPTIDRFSRRSLLSLNSNMKLEAWKGFVQKNASAFLKVAELLHERAVNELPLPTPSAAIAPREAECLLWTARGKDAKAIATILELSEYTVRSYLRTVRQKLQCRTLSQAVAIAIQQRLINP